MAAVVGRRHAVALSSGTAALHLALLVHGVGPGDAVLVSDLTFAASVNAIAYVGATPVLIDSDPATWNMSPDLAGRGARRPAGRAAQGGDRRRPLRPGGRPRRHRRRCSPSTACSTSPTPPRASAPPTTGGRPRPSARRPCSRFNGNKIITTTGGGMLVTDDAAVADRVRHLATQAREPVPHYEHTEVGYNYRLSNLLAAFGRAQLADLDRRVRAPPGDLRSLRRRRSATCPGSASCPRRPRAGPTAGSPASPSTRRRRVHARRTLREHLEALDIEARPTWKPMHLQPVFQDCPSRLDGTSARIFERGLCLPSGSSLTPEDQDRCHRGGPRSSPKDGVDRMYRAFQEAPRPPMLPTSTATCRQPVALALTGGW